MKTHTLTDQEAFAAVVGMVAKAFEPRVNIPLTEHPWLEPQGMSQLHSWKRELDGGALDVSRHLGGDL